MDTLGGDLNIFQIAGKIVYFGWWLILPIIFWQLFKVIWIDFVAFYSKNSWYLNQKWSVLEIIPPRDIESGPKPMESVFTGIAGAIAAPNTFDTWIKGQIPDRFSVELVGEEGKVHYYIRTQKKYRNMIEAQIYAQYPNAQVIEVEDYYSKFPKIVPNRDWDLWGTDFEFTRKKYFPIRTYDKFQEDITGNMVDPMAAMVEVLGTLGPGQHIWLQFVLQAVPEPDIIKESKEVIDELKGKKAVQFFGFLDNIMDVFSNVFKLIFKGELSFETADKKDEQPLEFRLSPMEKEILKAVEENAGKNQFTTKMRMIILGKREVFDKNLISIFIGSLKQFNDMNANQFKPEDISKTYGKIFFTEGIANLRKRKIYDRYRKRNMDGVNVQFSVKELATIFHFPNIVVKSPAVTQTSGKLGAAPSNLPVE